MILVDAGAILALANRADRHHEACREALAALREPLATAWPVLSEAVAGLARLPVAQERLLVLVERGALRVLALERDDAPRLRELMAKHRPRSMTLADAALVRLAERERLNTVFTLNTADFEAYRIGRKAFRVVPGRKALQARSSSGQR